MSLAHRRLSPVGEEVLDLLEVARELAHARDVDRVAEVVKPAVRALLRADGVTFVLREEDLVRYHDEDAIAPLWKGNRYPLKACISGLAMIQRQAIAIEDVFADRRVPHDLYRPTFVKSMLMVPVVASDAVAAIGAYWAERRAPTERDVAILESIAGFAAAALERSALEAELQSAVAARDDLLGIAAHELRTPLTVVKLAVHAAARAVAMPGEEATVRRLVERALRGTGRLDRLVETLLDSTRLAARRVPLERVRVDLGALVAEVVEGLGPEAGVAVEAERGVVGAWDRARLEQIVGNLVGNALKFGGGKPVRVEVSARDGHACLTVADEGIGISDAEQRRIFERFERGDAARQVGGFGLGLWIVRQNVEAHGGAITLASRPGHGARFEVTLPL